jgi:hypothetical protein
LREIPLLYLPALVPPLRRSDESKTGHCDMFFLTVCEKQSKYSGKGQYCN